ncbi:YhcN/YlaJ family sporulation lipoprotein [Neobacillus niacini]|uniref:YhcN/YlaJ family sporulation lipoprotein n=1 Tax=Neobacillus niacini TaxID=86668 RepID=UPI00203F9810|nr:YhcN/YlaJ family sporulation lipoprotein [Neobacillus niacini]MCM3694591.1 YhcN/YlaJ family sporulation lipoprotein [Neobacillus niacini]
MKKFRILLTCLCISVLAIGCNMKEEGRATDQHGEINNRNAGSLNVGNSLGNPNFNLTNMNNTPTQVNKTGLRVVNEAEENVQNLPEIKRANIIMANRTAYVAVDMDDDFHSELYPYLEDQIAQQIRDADASIQNVYISSNRDFVRQMSQYRDQIQNGRKAEGMNSGFNEMVHRFFNHHARINQD